MNKQMIFTLWGILFILCAGLGFLPAPDGTVRVLLTLAALAFFLPPAVLLYNYRDDHTLKLVRNISALSLGLTLVLLIVNFLTALASETLGTLVHYILVIVSSPLICSGHWALSLFLWACLLMVSLTQLKKK